MLGLTMDWVRDAARVLPWGGRTGKYMTKYPFGQDASVHVPLADRVVFGMPRPRRPPPTPCPL